MDACRTDARRVAHLAGSIPLKRFTGPYKTQDSAVAVRSYELVMLSTERTIAVAFAGREHRSDNNPEPGAAESAEWARLR